MDFNQMSKIAVFHNTSSAFQNFTLHVQFSNRFQKVFVKNPRLGRNRDNPHELSIGSQYYF